MQPIGNFNKISEKLKDSLKTLAPGEIVTYELLKSEKDHLTGRRLYGGAKTLPGRDRIRDGANLVEIGVPRVIDGNNVKKCDRYKLDGGGENGSVGARFSLNGNNPEHVMWHWFFQLCNFNASNTNAAASVEKLIREIDPSAEARKRKQTRSKLRDAIITAENLSNEAVIVFAAAHMWNHLDDIEVLRDRMEQFATENPDEFMRQQTSMEYSMKANLKIALENGILKFDPQKYQVLNAEDELVASLDKMPGRDHLEALYQWVKSSRTGDAVYEAVVQRVKVVAIEQGIMPDPNKVKGKKKPTPKEEEEE